MTQGIEPDRSENAPSFAARMKKFFGRDLDPIVSLHEEPSTDDAQQAGGGPANEFLSRLAAHAPHSTRYTLQGEIGRGGMGAVLKVWDADLRRQLAMKVAIGRRGALEASTPDIEPHVLSRFLEEAQVTGQLDHPGIVPVHELGLDEQGRVYFTMRLVRGRDFGTIIDLVHANAEGWTRTKALGVVLKVCEAMAYAHQKGVIHRDLKPSNVMIGRFGETYVMDWGLAKVLGRADSRDLRIQAPSENDLTPVRTERSDEPADETESPLVTMDGAIVGTPAYMPPEQARGLVDEIDARSDVYAVGAMLYHVLTGRMPYVAKDARVAAHVIWRNVLEGAPKPIHTLAPDVPAELAAVCDKAMARAKSDRYADTLALAEDIQAFLDGRVVHAFETGAAAELRKWVVRNKGIAAAAALVFVLAIAALLAIYRVQADASATVLATNHDLALRNTELAVARNEAFEKERAASRQGYVANLFAADACSRSGEMAEARRRLQACPEDLRGWEWNALWLATDTSLYTLQGSRGSVDALAFTPDGTQLVSGAGDGIVRIWNVDARQEANRTQAATAQAGNGLGRLRVSISADGERIFTSSRDALLSAWTAHTLARIPGDAEAKRRNRAATEDTLAISSDGQRWATTRADRSIAVWNAADHGEPLILRGHESSVRAAAFDASGTVLVSGAAQDGVRVPGSKDWDDATVRVWDVHTGTCLAVLRGHEAPVTSVAFERAGRHFASASEDGSVRVWNASTFDCELVLRGHQRSVEAIAFSDDGSRIASGSLDKTVRVWDARTGAERAVLRGHEREVVSVAFDALGTRIASGTRDGNIRVWDALASNVCETMSESDNPAAPIVAAAFDPTCARAAVMSVDGEVRMYDALAQEPLAVLHDTSPNGRSRREPWAPLAFSPDGCLLALGAADGTLRFLDTQSLVLGAPVQMHARGVAALAFSPDSTKIATCSSENSVRILDVNRKRPIAVRAVPSPRCLAFDRRGDVLAIGARRGVSSWQWKENRAELITDADLEATCVAFSSDGSLVAVGCEDGALRLVSLAERRVTKVLRGHGQAVRSVAYTPDGRRIVSAALDGTLRVWDSASGDNLTVLRDPEDPLVAAGIDQDGIEISAATTKGLIHSWRSAGDPIATDERAAALSRRVKARARVDELFQQLGSKQDVLSALRDDSALEPLVRESALRQARMRADSSRAMNDACWDVVRAAGRDADAYARAARSAEIALRAHPDDASYQTTLGVALYRTGELARSIAVLGQSASHRDHPIEHAFLTLAYAKSGRTEDATRSLAEMTRLMAQPNWSRDPECRAIADEVRREMASRPASK